MQYIIFGAGQTGRNAMHFLGYWRVGFFAANEQMESIDEKKVISYDEMIQYEKTGNYIIVVASARYNAEMVAQLKSDDIVRYFVFHDGAPQEIFQVYPGYSIYRKYVFVPYVKALSLLKISKYKRIVIYGENFFLPYLISEIAFQNNINNIVGIISQKDDVNINTLGIPKIKLENVWNYADCIVVNVKRAEIPTNDALILESVKDKFDILHLYCLDKFVQEFLHPELKKYKDIHRGKRCFLIGNGPSMRVDDLDTLYQHEEICFGFNKIYRIYNKTKWKANYLGISDPIMMENCYDELHKVDGEIFCTDQYHLATDIFFHFAQYVHVISEIYGKNHPGFSDDICKGVFAGYTVVYELGIQLAVYMGFKEIYLIGVDCSVTGHITDKKNHFIDDYFYEDEKSCWNLREKWNNVNNIDVNEQMKIAFEKAAVSCAERGVRVYNATRGGALEVFERVDFDELF